MKVAVMHCKAQQFGQSSVNTGNSLADKTAKEVAEQSILLVISSKEGMLPQITPRYDDQDQQLAEALKAQLNAESWWVTPTQQVIVSQVIMKQITVKEHNETHWGGEAVMENLKTQVLSITMVGIIKSIEGKCWICLQNHPQMLKRSPLGTIKKGNCGRLLAK